MGPLANVCVPICFPQNFPIIKCRFGKLFDVAWENNLVSEGKWKGAEMIRRKR